MLEQTEAHQQWFYRKISYRKKERILWKQLIKKFWQGMKPE